MLNLQFKKIRICSEAEQAGLQMEFHPHKNLLWGRNGAGKSAILKSVFRAFDAEPHGELPSWDYAAIIAVDFSVGGRFLTTVRSGDLRALFENDTLLGAATSSSQWNDIFASNVGFELRLLDRGGKFRHAAPSNFFLPFFINQDGSFGADWSTFNSIKQFQRPVEQTLEYFARVRPPRYFELKASEQTEKAKSSELKVELATLQRTRLRLRRNVKATPVKLSSKDFHAEIKELTERAVNLAKKQETLRKNIVEDQELVISFAEQIRLSNAALKEHNSDFKFAAEISAKEHKFVCPTCQAEHDDSFHTFLGLSEDARELTSLKNAIERSLESTKLRLERSRRKAVELREQYGAIQELLNVKKGKFSFEDFIRSYSANTADAQLLAEERSVDGELIAVANNISNIKLALKEVEAQHDSKQPVERFREYFARSIVELDVDKPVGLEKWTLAKRPYNSGSRYARSIIAYYAALWRTIEQDGHLPAPVVIDSPNQGAQDKEHLQMLLSVLAATAPKNTQVILAHEAVPENFNADKIFPMSSKTRLLNSAEFQVVAPELFSFVEKARGYLIGVKVVSDDEFVDEMESD
jgi:hypothetical protein